MLRRLSLGTGLLILALCGSLATAGKNDAQRAMIQAQIESLNRQIQNLQQQEPKLKEQISQAETQQKRVQAESASKTTALRTATQEYQSLAGPYQAAKIKADKADLALKALMRKLRERMEASPEMTAAKKAVDDAHDAQATARTAAIAPLESKPEYVTATGLEKASRTQLEKLRYADPPDQPALSKAAMELMERQNAVAALEQPVIQADPSYQQADARYAAATKALAAERETIERKIKSDPEYVVAARETDDAKAKLAALKGPFEDATKRQTAARAAAYRAQEQARSLTSRLNSAQSDLHSCQQNISSLTSQREQRTRDLSNLR